MSQQPLPVVGCFIFNTQGEILLVKSPKWGEANIWCVPGGKVDWREKISEAAVRETKEEVGLDVKFLEIFAVYDAIFPKFFYKKKHFIFFECELKTLKKQPIRIDGREIVGTSWFSLSKAVQLTDEPFTKKALKTLLKKA